MEQRIAAIVRLVVSLAVAIAAACGLALDGDALMVGVSCALALVCFIYTWWKNNNITEAAQKAQEVLDGMKNSEMEEE